MSDDSDKIINGLLAELPKEMISWRPQNLTQKKDKALALAYIDARDVMDVLDRVCGAASWQSQHFDAGGNHTGCRIGIKLDDEWIWKSDGAGESKVEGEKGLFSGSFKRAAVMWGIARYLYDFENVYVPCSTYKDNNGNIKFSKFTDDPWNYCRRSRSVTAKGNVMKAKEAYKAFIAELETCEEKDQVDLFVNDPNKQKLIKRFQEVIPEWVHDIDDVISNARKKAK